MLNTLLEIYNKYKVGDWPDKGSVHSYIDVYEKLLAPYRHTAKNILEIGLMSGESLRMWTDYFDGSVHGIDCEVKPIGGVADLTTCIFEGYQVYIGDASNPEHIEKHFKGKKFDVVLEDANHDLGQQLKMYHVLSPYLSEDGIYIIEDIQDLDATKEIFENIDSTKRIEILDRRQIKSRYDDVMVIIKSSK